MRPIHLVYVTLAAASVFAAPTATKPGLVTVSHRQDSPNLSSHTANGLLDSDVQPAAPSIVLPPVTEVFALMAASTASSNPPSPSLAAMTIHLGPGLASSPTEEHIAVPPTHTSSQNISPPYSPPLAHRSVFAAVVVLSLIAVMLAVYAGFYLRHQLHANKINGGQLHALPAEAENKENVKVPRCSVVDISRNFPRSKFSVTSSDYAISARVSSASDSESESESGSRSECESGTDSETDSCEHGSERGLMNPAHFFALRPSSMAWSRRHSRGESAPIVVRIPQFDVRRDQSRRSRSVSGGRYRWS
ncbi:hypothetical protein GGX14DRAFT_565202 [Mycena pura]|uniref:Uncharacterized protein n=1 Tax=Mycena pura TaxID=153505 RepID=A0AAD6YB77_9AGAR|nr:hypothetical protein GGX14DRAFT_565202 [Mycena pura]